MNKLILISDPGYPADEALLINRMFDAGLTLFHLRKPEHTEAEVLQLLSGIQPEYHERIALPFSLAQHKRSPFPGCRKIHFFEHLREQTKAEYFETLKDKGYMLSTSIHDAETLDTLSPAFDYTFFGPVFDSISKPGYPAMNKGQLQVLRQKRNIDVIGLGGISVQNCKEAMGYGFDGVAVLGAVWKSSDPLEQFKAIQQCLTGDQ